MKRNELGNFENSIRLAINDAHRAIEMTMGLMRVFFNSPDSDSFSKKNHTLDVIKRFPVSYEIEINYTKWEDERYSVSYFLHSLSTLADYFTSMKVIIKSMLPYLDSGDLDLSNEADFYPSLLHIVNSVSKLAKRIEDEYKSTDWSHEDMRDYVPYNRVKKFISLNLSYYAKKHQAPIVESFRDYILKKLEKFADGEDVGEISFEFFYSGGHDSISCEFLWDHIRIARYGWDDGAPLDGGTFEWWSYTLREDGCGEGEMWDMDISAEIDNGMQLSITQPSEFRYGHDES